MLLNDGRMLLLHQLLNSQCCCVVTVVAAVVVVITAGIVVEIASDFGGRLVGSCSMCHIAVAGVSFCDIAG